MPHLLQQPNTQLVSRADLFDAVSDNAQPDAGDLKFLHELIRANLEQGPLKKKRKLDHPSPTVASETSVLFPLLAAPRNISLLPPPPPAPVTREPECEDNAAAAETRRQRAEAVAVDAAWVMQESVRLRPPFRAGRVEHVQAKPTLSAPMLLVHRLQAPRKTRPPVPRSQLQHYPYVSAPIPPSVLAKGPVPSIELLEVPTRNQRRRRGKQRERAQATFWRPPEGQSLGYGMGY
ncbi:hypothetical protein FB45DRAFT_887888 [Roridomyces roridus]|uniref:Uncharacterized protein n=1 Tax=Roridomyces roridus TaxID=1738132 RepID=A0AAD7FYU7_9AGAR|nr:hypothetical protein FB45DRAFT_887888 [Roridomyces roridus]